MNRYTKIINMMESYFTKDFEKTKKGFTKVREVKEETVRKAFLKGNCEVLVILEDSDREIQNLKEIEDNYPKYIVTLDKYDSGNIDGIEIVYLEDFLLKSEY